MPQGWSVNATTDIITFLEAPASGTNNVVVKEYGSSTGATDVWALGAFSPAYGWPAEGEYFGDRMVLAASLLQPQTLWMSRIGDYGNFSRSVPLADDDALSFTINARRLNAIRDLCALDNLVPLTLGGEWKMAAEGDVVSPTTVGFDPESYWGSSKLPAQVIGKSALFVEETSQHVRELAYSFTSGESGGYEGGDLAQRASHLFDGFRLVDVSTALAPYKVVWYARDDGVLLGMTYDREQQVVAWHTHDTRGYVESVCCIPEGNEVATYLVVRRVIGGQTVRYHERLASRRFDAIEDAFFVDSGLTYDGRNTTATTLTLSGGTLWDDTETLTATASAALFLGAGDVGDMLYLHKDTETFEDNRPVTTRESVRVTITAYTSPTAVQVRPVGLVPAALRASATATWTLARDTISGLEHLEGETVAVLADGNVQEQKVVTAGAITLDYPGGVVHVGLPYRAVGESLDVNVASAETVRGTGKLISKVYMQVRNTRGLQAGPSLARLDSIKEREFEDYDQATQTITGLVEVQTEGNWDRNGRFFFVQPDPLPAEVLALIPDVTIGGKA
jgi:hypothetical protein